MQTMLLPTTIFNQQEVHLDTYKWYSTRRWKQSAYRKQSKPKGLTYERTNNKFSNSSATYARLLVVYDKQPNGALPTYATVMQTRDNAGAASNTAFSDPNFDNKERFTILRDTTFVLPSVTNTVGVLTNVGFDQGTKMTSTYSMLTCI